MKGVEIMIARCILKVIGVLTLVSISIVALAVILLVGWFLLAMIIPNRMNVTGRITDIAGRPIRAAQVHAVPLAIFDAHSEDSTKPARGKAQTVVTDEHGRFRLERLIASGGVKEGMWLQEYDISIKACATTATGMRTLLHSKTSSSKKKNRPRLSKC
jgi:hypothetical protein